MGIFSSKKKHYVDTAVVRVVEDKLVPDLLYSAIAETIFDDADITRTIQQESLYGNFRNFEKAARWASKPGNYAFGLPNVRSQSSSDGFGEARTALRADINKGDITVDYMQFRPLNNVHAGYKWVTENWGHNAATNELTVLSEQKGFPVYLDKMVSYHDQDTTEEATVPEITSIGVFGNSPFSGWTPERKGLINLPGSITQPSDLVIEQEVVVRPGIESVVIHWVGEKLTYVDSDPPADPPVVKERELIKGSYELDLSEYDGDREYYQAKWSKNGETGYWIYDVLEGRYPALDRIFVPSGSNEGSFFPFIVFRNEAKNYAKTSSAEDLAGTVKLCKYMGFDYLDMSDQIHENDDVKDIRQAVMMVAVPITTDDQIQIEYLYEHFKEIKKDQHAKWEQNRPFSQAADLAAGSSDSYALQISDADFSMSLSFDRIEIKEVSGDIPDGEMFSNSQSKGQAVTAILPGLRYTGPVIESNVRYIRKQLFPGAEIDGEWNPGVYEEIKITNPQIRFPIALNGKKSVEGGANDDRLLIPIDYNVAKKLNILKREHLYFVSLNLVFNSHVVQKVKWYQRGAFKIVLAVVAVVLAWFTYGATLKAYFAAIATAATAAAATAAVIALAQFILGKIVVSVVISFAMQELAEIIGAEWAIALAVVAMSYGVYKGISSGAWMGNTTAVKMVNLGNSLIGGANAALKDAFADWNKELQEFNLMKDELWEELKELQDALIQPVNVDPLTFVDLQPLTIWGENPDQYYGRTVHSGNIGVESLQIVENFVPFSLRLPTTVQTLGDIAA